MKEYTHQQWMDELKSRFGENIMDWAFKCPACGKVSTIREFIDAGAEIHDSFQNCIGRFTGKGSPQKGDSSGCDWAAYGLFGTMDKGDIVITRYGNRMEVFPMAEKKEVDPVIEACLEDIS
jgi:hypothetical protein